MKKVEKMPSIQGYKDIERLNRLMYEKGGNDKRSGMSSPTEDDRECSKPPNITLIEILSRTIVRMDELESTVKQLTSLIYDIKNQQH